MKNRIARTVAEHACRELLLERVPAVCIRGSAIADDHRSSGLVFPGSFNPLHAAHREMAVVGTRQFAAQVEYEISIQNVDKPPTDGIEMAKRVAQFTDDETIWLTRAPTFVEKSKIFPGAIFLVGADTLTRIADSAYYGGHRQSQAAFSQLAERNCRFLTFGRAINDRFCSPEDLDLPKPLGQLCLHVPSSTFRHDLSSTSMRNAEPD